MVQTRDPVSKAKQTHELAALWVAGKIELLKPDDGLPGGGIDSQLLCDLDVYYVV